MGPALMRWDLSEALASVALASVCAGGHDRWRRTDGVPARARGPVYLRASLPPLPVRSVPARPSRPLAAGLLVAAVALAACGSEPEASAEAPSAETAEAPPGLLALTPEGVGGITGEMPFDPGFLRATLPDGWVVEVGQIEIPAPDTTQTADTLQVFYAFYDGLIVLEVYPDARGERVGRVDATGEGVIGPGDRRVGATFSAIGGPSMTCEPGADELEGRAVCAPVSGSAIRYVFAHGAAAPPGQLPPEGDLADAMLERMIWEP